MALSHFKGRIAPILTLSLFLLLAQSYTASGAVLRDSDSPGALKKLHSLQIPFIENKGQIAAESVRYYARTFGGTVFITEDGEIVYALPKYDTTGQAVGARRAVPLQEPIQEKSGWTLKESFAGASIVNVSGEDPAATSVSYFKGSDPAKWKTGLTTYNQLNLGEIYSGIELKLKAYGNNMEKLFHVKPGADPGMIKIMLDIGAGPTVKPGDGSPSLPGDVGATGGRPSGLSVNDKGELEIETGLGVVKFTKPLAYQEEMGRGTAGRAPTKKYVEVSYAVEGDGYTFKVGEYDRGKDLVIDPLLASTFIGGSATDVGSSIALDGSGNVYVVGSTLSTSSDYFPTTTGAYDTTYNGGFADVFVAKLDSTLTSLLASTFIGGSGDDEGVSIAIATAVSGNVYVYVAGYTSSPGFPTTTGAYDTTHNGSADLFVAKLDSALQNLLASTFIGGNVDDYNGIIALDANGNVYVTGYTYSSNFPTTTGAYDTAFNAPPYGYGDAFVIKLSGDLSSLSASTFIGGSSDEVPGSIALDANGDVYVAGFTKSSDFPTTTGAYDEIFNGIWDGFVSKLNSALSSLSASTFIGGSGQDVVVPIALDGSGNVYVAGYTTSSNFPTTLGAYDETYNGSTDPDVFVAKLNGALTSLSASTFIGGSSDERGISITLDANGNVYVTGNTRSSDFPTTAGAYDTTYNTGADVFAAKLNGNLMSLSASTFIGGGDNDYGYAIALDAGGNVYVAGQTASSDFPTTTGAYDTTYNASYYGGDVFVTKLDSALSLAAAACPLEGDLNHDGILNILDAILLLLCIAGPC